VAWTNYECEIKERPALVLVDKRFVGCEPTSALPKVFWLCVYTRLPPGGAYWNPDETNVLNKLEDDFIDLLSDNSRGHAAYVLRIATPGLREYYIYHSTAVNLASTHAALCKAYPDYKIVFNSFDDPTWREYNAYATFTPSSWLQRCIRYLRRR
jgi:hypothetical protein